MMSQHRIENENLKMQVEAYKNEVELLKQEQAGKGEDQGKQIRSLQQALQGMQQVRHTKCTQPRILILPGFD